MSLSKTVGKASNWAGRQLFGGPKQAQYAQPIPEDLKGLRGGNIDLLTTILRGGANSNDALGKIFGQMGSPQTGLQRQSLGGISQFLNQPAPEQRALDISMPMLQNLLSGKPGQGIIDALQPTFERNLASANQQGGRFGSANAILRSRALEDFNLLGARAAETGINQQMQAAQVLAMLSGQAGSAPFNRMTQAYGIGSQDAQQMDLETQRRLSIIASLLGGGMDASFNIPYVQTQAGQRGGWSQGMDMLGTLIGYGAGKIGGGEKKKEG